MKPGLTDVSGLDRPSRQCPDNTFEISEMRKATSSQASWNACAGSGDNQTIVGFAKETLPRLEMHLGHVKELVQLQ